MPPDGPAVATGVAVGLVLVAYGSVFGAAEILRARGVSGETTRTTVHVLSGLVGLTLPFLFGSPWPIVLLAAAFACGLLASRPTGLLGSVHDVGRPTVGAEAFPLGIAATFAITAGHAPAYPIAVLALALGDPAASIVGRRFGGRSAGRLGRATFSICGTRRSVEGSTAAFLVTTLFAAGVLFLEGGAGAAALLATAGAVGLAVSVAEALSPRGLDNLAIPVVAAMVVGATGMPWGLPVILLLLADAGAVLVAWRAWTVYHPGGIGRLRWPA